MIEIKIECLNPGCKINYKVDEVTTEIEETLTIMTDEVIRIMNNRELPYKQFQNKKLEGLTIETSDGSSKQEIEF